MGVVLADVMVLTLARPANRHPGLLGMDWLVETKATGRRDDFPMRESFVRREIVASRPFHAKVENCFNGDLHIVLS